MDRRKPIIALDFNRVSDLNAFLSLFGNKKLNIKIGMELFYANGPTIVNDLIEAHHDIFLDLKLHDIPNTVKHSMQVLAELGVSMVNVHAKGGIKMMAAAREGLEIGTPADQKRPKLIGVTQLTSLSGAEFNYEQSSKLNFIDSIKHYAKLAHEAGLDGVVCSPHEADLIHKAVSQNFLTVTPGIRLEDKKIDDQTRIMTPNMAAKAGSDYIVVGRPITQANDPLESYQQIYKEWAH